MDGANRDTNISTTGLEVQKKRKWRKRGKHSQMSKDVENGSSDSNVVENDAQDNEDIEENIISITKNCTLDDSSRYNNNSNENSETTCDAFAERNSTEIENTRCQIESTSDPLDGDFGAGNLISDNNINIFTDSLSSHVVKLSEKSSNIIETEVFEPVEFGSDDVDKMYPSNSSATKVEETPYNTKALHKKASTYQLEKFVKNVLIILNQKNFIGSGERKGTDQDVIQLMKTFQAFDFDVLPYTNRTKSQITAILEAVSSQNFTDYGCVGIAILTHGGENGELLTRDDKITEMDIINSLKTHKNPTLVSKPRLVIIQACRGKKAIAGVPVLRRGRIRTDLDYETEPYTLPVEADMLVLHSSYAGNPAHRHETEGSWFIQTLCKKINEMAPTHDLESILTEVKLEVAVDKEHEVLNPISGEVDVNKQIPVVTTTLIRKLYLRRYAEGEENSASNMNETSANVAVDAPNVGPGLDTCLCALDYFAYIKKCLRYYVEGKPEDTAARSLLELTETFKSEMVFNSAKEKCAVAISHHLDLHAKNSDYYKYLHIYKK